MANEGTLITAAVTLLAGAAFFAAAQSTRPHTTGRNTRPLSLFCDFTALFLLLAGLRQVVAYFSGSDPTLVELDRTLFLFLIAPAAGGIVPLSYLTAQLLGAPGARPAMVAGLFAVLVLVGMAFLYAGGLQGPDVSYWGTEWTIRSPVALVMIVGVVTLPALACSGFILYAGLKLTGGDRRRLATVGGSLLVYYLVFTTDAFALPGIILAAERLITAGAALAIRHVYRTPATGASP